LAKRPAGGAVFGAAITVGLTSSTPIGLTEDDDAQHLGAVTITAGHASAQDAGSRNYGFDFAAVSSPAAYAAVWNP
jgi:hypothetical protein